ncbi:MAG: alkaline phosphatase family protein [Streptosporangiales bacterium]
MLDRTARRWSLIGAGLTAAATILATSGALPSLAAHGEHHRGGYGGHHLDHVFTIMIENHAPKGPGVGVLEDEKNMPFLNGLADRYATATSYYGVTHPSEPNYIASTSGSTWWTNDDDGWCDGNGYPNPSYDPSPGATFGGECPHPEKGNHYPHTNIVDQLEARHIPWAAYMDAMPDPGYLGDAWPSEDNELYASKHNPFILYNDIRRNPSRRDNIKPYDQMAADLDHGRVPRYVWISPDNCNNLHGGVSEPVQGHAEAPCPYGNANDPGTDANEAALRQKADAFLKHAVHTITESRAWTGNSVIFIVADEGDYTGQDTNAGWEDPSGCCDSPVLPKGDPQIGKNWPGGVFGGGYAPMVVVSTHGPRHSVDDTPYNHYSMLRTVEQGFGLPYLGYAADGRRVQTMWPLISRR